MSDTADAQVSRGWWTQDPRYPDYAETYTDAELRELVESDYEPPFPWLAGCARYADTRALIRRAVRVLLTAPPDHGANVVPHIMKQRAAAIATPDPIAYGDARNSFIAVLDDPNSDFGKPWVDMGEEFIAEVGGIEKAREHDEYHRVRGQATKAAHFLATRGYHLTRLLALRPLLQAEDSDARVDQILLIVDAGLTRTEIQQRLAVGEWPPTETLRTLAALRGR